MRIAGVEYNDLVRGSELGNDEASARSFLGASIGRAPAEHLAKFVRDLGSLRASQARSMELVGRYAYKSDMEEISGTLEIMKASRVCQDGSVGRIETEELIFP